MKRIILLFLVILKCFCANAGQKYTAFIVKGDITVIINGKSIPIKPGEVYDDSDIINVTQGAYLTFKSSNKNHHTLTINKPYRGSIKGIKKHGGIKVKRTSSFMDVIKGKTSQDFIIGRTMSAGGIGYRDLFINEEEEIAYEELQKLLKDADLID